MNKIQFSIEMDAISNKQKVLKEILSKMPTLHRDSVKLSKNGIKGIDPQIGKNLMEYKDLSAEALKLTEEVKKDSKLLLDHFMN